MSIYVTIYVDIWQYMTIYSNLLPTTLEMFKALIFTILGEHRAEDTKHQNTTSSTIKMQPWSLMKIHSNHAVWQCLGCLEGGRMHQNNTNKRGAQTMLKIFKTVIFVVLGEQRSHDAINYFVPTSQYR